MLPESVDSAVQVEPAFRRAEPADGKAMYKLVREMGGLELNTAYFYILFCIDFADTCVVAEVDGKLAGFVLGHRPPKRPDAVFVWQVGVAPWMRKQGLARKLLEAFLAQNPDARWLEASVTPDNQPSRKLFQSVARDKGVDCEISDYMPAELFPDGHEAEDLFRIGPFDSNSNRVGKQ
jgi:L-2,4-diaminobutyric acid acetyltransferase